MVNKRIRRSITAALVAGVMSTATVVPVMAASNNDAHLTGNGKDVKNVILMISDGWGYNQILATDYYTEGKAGTQVYENFPTQLALSTYSLGDLTTEDNAEGVYDPATVWENFNTLMNNPTDSAAAGTAMSTGVKTYDAAIGVDEQPEDLTHMTQDFEAQGKATGVVSSVEFSHATPASFVAHHESRNDYSFLANEMIKDSATDVIMGAGNPLYTDNGDVAAAPNYRYVGGAATWNGLVDGSLDVSDADGDGIDDAWTLIQSKEEFEALQIGETASRVIGVPEVYTTLQQARGGDAKADAYEVEQNNNVPGLDVMTTGALNVLDNDEDGFFLMVEGGAIDWAGHANQSGRLIEEQAAFNDSVEAVYEWVEENSNWGETLLIVTGDHETGYLTGTAGVYDEVVNNGEGVMPTMAWNSGNHTNQLIPFFAKGAGAEILKKVADETDPVRGAYLDNTEISEVIRTLID
ncbi:alkaline phosphatase [Trichococcus shcherbakoviae]|uniref:alkaline phosphatase n=1 Tax=Trichococcus shcherbakoviae TaxID=2094020 RepID=UPI0029F46971|nr:alkaline phosphatase [Trichococcus shcherbakoviae]